MTGLLTKISLISLVHTSSQKLSAVKLIGSLNTSSAKRVKFNYTGALYSIIFFAVHTSQAAGPDLIMRTDFVNVTEEMNHG